MSADFVTAIKQYTTAQSTIITTQGNVIKTTSLPFNQNRQILCDITMVNMRAVRVYA